MAATTQNTIIQTYLPEVESTIKQNGGNIVYANNNIIITS